MPLSEKYKITWTSSGSGSAKDNRAPANTYRYNDVTKAWDIIKSSTATGGDIPIDVSDALRIYLHGALNSTASSTLITVKVHASWGTTGDRTITSTGITNWTSSGNPYTSLTMSTASATCALTNDYLNITPGPSFLRFRADASSSGGYALEGLRVFISVQKQA